MVKHRTTILTTKTGKVRGVQCTSEYSNRNYFSFLGIPYAKPPLRNRRFKPPEPIKNLSNVYDATFERDGCFQFSYYEYRVVGSEDCLYLNVHTPELQQEPSEIHQPKAVIVMIHGGSMLWGSGSSNVNGSPAYVMHQDVIYVTIHYRLHVLGFLNLDLLDCPGNVGLNDIVMALQWIKENIICFGGDSSNITLLGYSSGAIIIHALMLSPLAKGLFHKVIMMGMYLFHPFVVFKERPLEVAFQFGKRLGFEGDDRFQLLKFLKKQTPQALLQALKEQTDFAEEVCKEISLLRGKLEKIAEGAFITSSPAELMASISAVPIIPIYGCCEIENIFAFIPKYQKFIQKNSSTIYRQNIHSWLHTLDDDEIEIIQRKLDCLYTSQEIDMDQTQKAIKVQKDISVLDCYHTIADVISVKSPSTSVYVYHFEYEGTLNYSANYTKFFVPHLLKGSCHSDDVHYWMCKVPKPNACDSEMVETITTLFTNFAKTANPNGRSLTDVYWKPTSPQQPYYLCIKKHLQLYPTRLSEGKLSLWEEIKKLYVK